MRKALFIHASNRYLLNIPYVVGSMLGAREKIVQSDTVPTFMEHVVFW